PQEYTGCSDVSRAVLPLCCRHDVQPSIASHTLPAASGQDRLRRACRQGLARSQAVRGVVRRPRPRGAGGDLGGGQLGGADALRDCVARRVTVGVGLAIIVPALPVVFGMLSLPREAPWVSLCHAIAGLPRVKVGAAAVALISLLAAVAMRQMRVFRGVLLV